MATVLTVWGVLAAAFAVLVLSSSKSAIHEILAGMGFLIATVAIGCAAIVQAMNGLNEKLRAEAKVTRSVATPVQDW